MNSPSLQRFCMCLQEFKSSTNPLWRAVKNPVKKKDSFLTSAAARDYKLSVPPCGGTVGEKGLRAITIFGNFFWGKSEISAC